MSSADAAPENDELSDRSLLSIFSRSPEPAFILNSQRRLTYANRAWEQAAGVTFLEAKGRTCRRRVLDDRPDRIDAVLSTLAPPDLAGGEGLTVVRRVAWGGPQGSWWEISYFPVSAANNATVWVGRFTVTLVSSSGSTALPERLLALRRRHASQFDWSQTVARAPASRRLLAQSQLAASLDVPVCLTGPPGAGKAWWARAVHQNSRRADAFFVGVKAGQIPADLLESILQPSRLRRIGAGGVYIGDAHLLRRELQNRIAQWTSNPDDGADAEMPRLFLGFSADPHALVREGTFSADLFRKCIFPLETPSLLDRLDDLQELAEKSLADYCTLRNSPAKTLSMEARSVLVRHGWRRNVRELQEVMHAAAQKASHAQIEVSDLPFYLVSSSPTPTPKLPLDAILENVERRVTALALRLSDSNHTRAAAILGVWRARLIRRLEKLGLNEQGSVSTDTSQDEPDPTNRS